MGGQIPRSGTEWPELYGKCMALLYEKLPNHFPEYLHQFAFPPATKVQLLHIFGNT